MYNWLPSMYLPIIINVVIIGICDTSVKSILYLVKKLILPVCRAFYLHSKKKI